MSVASLELPTLDEVLAHSDYAPQDHLLPAAHHHNIAEIPGSPEALLRWFPYSSGSDLALASTYNPVAFGQPSPRLTRDMAEAAVENHQIQMERLAAVGVPVVRHTLSIRADNPLLGSSPTIFMVTERLQGRKLEFGDQQAAGIIKGLAKYVIGSSDNEPIMSDIYKPEQFTLVAGTDRRAVLHDIEPLFRSGSRRQSILGSRMFQNWLSYNVLA